MNIHNDIRKEVLSLLENNLEGISRYSNGVPRIADLDADLPLVAVFIDDANADQSVIGYQEWHAGLNIVSYLPFEVGEAGLDALSEKIYNLILKHAFENLSIKFARSYDYDFDTTSNVWISSAIAFDITYKFEQINNFEE
ncbi:phage tail terminator protein [Avibacterium sp. 21-594]|uniref:phage tail terminator protein n=1 Tax=Avibacterium sp. 21-594 TaxID=2911535 RepID=UPI002246B893|nr:phage tail terminator protein [Avibacterium sp. 21-594]MCW9716708.1 phage minor tail U family protein [Avibacterium sp. 21-594]